MWKIFVEPNRPQMAMWRKRIACWIPKATNTLKICNTYCFFTPTMVARTRLIVAFILDLPVWFICYCRDSAFPGVQEECPAVRGLTIAPAGWQNPYFKGQITAAGLSGITLQI
jgi:hypothetical protein